MDKQKEQKVIQNLAEKLVAAANTTSLLRRDVIRTLLNPDKDIDSECGYPSTIGVSDYKKLYDREAVANRMVKLEPEEAWSQSPEIYEDEDSNQTVWEKAFEDIDKTFHLKAYMERIDVLSGIGQFGLLLIGIDDKKDLIEPVDGVDLKTGEWKNNKDYQLLYLRTFSQDVIDVSEKEIDPTSKRYGMPVIYDIKFEDWTGGVKNEKTQKVHWTRTVHIADNREESEVYGIPRLQAIYNRLLDFRKTLAGSAEMFWKGGYPGYAFEVLPEASDVTLDTDSLQEQMLDFSQGLQRYLAVSGMAVKSLQPQVSDPTGHLEAQIKAMCTAKGIPYRLFIGSEKGQLASTQDMAIWNMRVHRRQERYVTPMVIRPIIERFMALGILPEIENFFVEWPDRDSPSEKDIAEIALIQTEAMSKYVGGGVDALIDPRNYLLKFMQLTEEEIDAIEDAVIDREETFSEEASNKAVERETQKEKETTKEVPANEPPNVRKS